MEGLLTNNLLSKSDIFNKSGGSNIKSVQRAVTSIASNQVFSDVTIAQVDLSTATIELTFDVNQVANQLNQTMLDAYFLNNTTVRVLRNTSFPGITGDISIEVKEWANLKSLQTGTKTTTTNSEETVTVANFNSNKAMLINNFTHTNTDNRNYGTHIFSRIIDDNTIGFKNTYSDITTRWQLLEFN